MQYSKDDIIRLIGLAYRSVDGPDGWNPFFEEMSRVSGMNTIALSYAGTSDTFELNLVHGMELAHMMEWAERIAPVDPFRQPALDRPPGQHVEPAENLVPRDVYLQTEFYDFVRRVGCDDIVLAIDKSPGHDIVSFTALTPLGVRIDETHVEFMRTIAPHVFHAVELSRQIAHLKTRAKASRDALSRADFGCIFLNEEGETEWINDFGRRLLETDAMELQEGKLHVRHPTSRARFERALRVGLGLAVDEDKAEAPIVEIERLDEGRPLEMLISPLQALPNTLSSATRGVMLIIADPEYVDEGLAERLASLYGLTPTEAEVAQWILSGASLPRIADIFGNSVHTIRTHVKRLMSKCQVCSQAELVGVLQRSLARLM